MTRATQGRLTLAGWATPRSTGLKACVNGLLQLLDSGGPQRSRRRVDLDRPDRAGGKPLFFNVEAAEKRMNISKKIKVVSAIKLQKFTL